MTKRNIIIALLAMLLMATLLFAADDPGTGLIDNILAKYGVYVVLLALGWVAGRYLKPWIHANAERLARAKEIGLICDRVTDELRILKPDAHWTQWIDDAVDRVLAACDLPDNDKSRILARREIMHQIAVKINPLANTK